MFNFDYFLAYYSIAREGHLDFAVVPPIRKESV